MDSSPGLPPTRLAKFPTWVQWTVLAAVTALISGTLYAVSMPAALLIGAMLSGIVVATNGAVLRPGPSAIGISQAVVGALVAASISPAIFTTLTSDWPLILGVCLATLAASGFVGWLVSRLRIMPGTTGVWGAAPGGATIMVLTAEAFGADARLVAFMQYLRVFFVSVAAALIAHMWVDASHVAAPARAWFPTIVWPAFAAMLAVVAAGGALGRLLRLPTPGFFGAFLLGGILHLGFGLELQLPQWLLAVTYTIIGWMIGLNFTASILRHALRILPVILASIFALIAFCGALAWVLSHQLGVDPLTAYLATSPGGMDSIAIIAAAADNVDMSFIMALQTSRLVMVMFFGPPLARRIARLIKD